MTDSIAPIPSLPMSADTVAPAPQAPPARPQLLGLVLLMLVAALVFLAVAIWRLHIRTEQLQSDSAVMQEAMKTARADLVFLRIDLFDLQVGREPQRFRNREHAGPADLLLRDHVDGRGRAAQALRGLGNRRDLDMRQLLE